MASFAAGGRILVARKRALPLVVERHHDAKLAKLFERRLGQATRCDREPGVVLRRRRGVRPLAKTQLGPCTHQSLRRRESVRLIAKARITRGHPRLEPCNHLVVIEPGFHLHHPTAERLDDDHHPIMKANSSSSVMVLARIRLSARPHRSSHRELGRRNRAR